MQSQQFQAHAALEERHWWFRGRQQIVSALLHSVLPPSKSTHIVDVGCGTGWATSMLDRDFSCVGIDPIDEAIGFAKARFPGTNFRRATIEECPEIKTADAVVMLDVLEHIEDDFLFVSTLLSRVKHGAYILLVAPADPNLWGMHDRGFEDYRRYSLERFRMLWEGLPVRECLVSHCNSRLYLPAKAVRFLTRMTGRSLGSGNTDLSLPVAPLNRLLEKIFAGERFRLLKGETYRKGVSVLALLEKTEGTITPRCMPEGVHDERRWMA